MSQSTNFDPPETVVPIAFRELLERLRRARITSPKPSEINDEERKAFDYGVQQRKRVLEHTLFLVFGQWALYRQAVSKLQSRGLRLLYGAGSVLSTVAFVRHRASQVSADMFAHIVTTGVDSPLGNEARIVLAELEGPEGPYFRHVCRERGFETDLFDVVAGMEEGGDPEHDVHPQLRLRPRLLNDTPMHPHVFAKTDIRKPSRQERDFGRGNERNSRSVVPEQQIREQRKRQGMEDWNAGSATASELPLREERNAGSLLSVNQGAGEGEESREQLVQKAKERKRASLSGDSFERETKEDLWGKPFDFAQAAAASWEHREDEEVHKEDKANMTPSQRRAMERRERRMRVRDRLKAEDDYRMKKSREPESVKVDAWDANGNWDRRSSSSRRRDEF